MKLRWPIHSYSCDDCGHIIRRWQKPWFAPLPIDSRLAQALPMIVAEFRMANEMWMSPK